MSKIQFRLARSLIKPTPLIRYRSFSIVPCRLEAKKTKPELLPDVRLQELVAELERPLNLKSVSIDDTRDNLLSSVESYRPQKPILPDPDIEKLIAGLSRSFTVAQLNAYIKAHSVPGKGTKKQQLMERIIYQHWGVKSLEKVRQEELEKKRDRVSAVLPATLQELFFVIGENGKTMKDIENIYDVNITVDVEKGVYILEGPSKSVSSAKKELQSRLNVIKQDHVDLPQKVIDDKRLQIEIDEALGSLSKLAGSFITLKDNKIHIASVSNESMDDAKRLSNLLLTELDVTDKKPLDKADNVYVQRFSEYTALPLHDFKAMTLYNEYLNWDRLKCDKSEEGNFRLLSDEQGSVDFDKLGESLLKPYEDVSNISLEARFGYLLFQNMKEKAYYRVKSENLNDLFTKNRTTFLPVNPPYEITTPFDPLTIENGFHQRSIQLEYVNKGLLYNYESDNKDLERVQIEFNVDKRGDIELKNIIGEKSRRTIDVLGVHGQIDIRLIAKNYVNYNNKLGDLIEKCKLISYNDLEAPKSYDNLLLSDIKFMNKKNYTFENNLITIQHIEQQYKNTKRTELVVNPKTGSWPSFSSALTKVASRWNYVSTRDQL